MEMCSGMQANMSEPASATESVFPEIDEMLAEVEYQRALRFVAERKSMENYRTMVDFLYAEFFGRMHNAKEEVLAFYQDRGPQLIDIVDFDEIEERQKWLVLALKHALHFQLSSRGHNWSWGWTKFRAAVLRAA